ncbi:MAG: LysM peptidoglycan-binding domain-containing protein [Thiobacillus sp.]
MNRLSLAVLALLLSFPAVAAEPRPNLQQLEWHGDKASGVLESELAAQVSQTDVWQRIRNGFKIDDEALQNPLVATHESWYAARPHSVRRLAERSRPYLFHIVQELDRRSMPMEIALLPMIESAFNPNALSPSAASGIWQFIPSTGRNYGLKQDTWYDGRRDFTAATNAALDYLGKLYLDFGDWQLALAAYNCGEGCVGRAIQKNVAEGLPTDYASLTLPNETRQYVPKLLAIKSIISNPGQYGVNIDALPNQPYFGQVTVSANMDVHSAARLANISSDEFIALNAAFPRKLIRSDTPVNLLIPVDKTAAFQRNLETANWDSWQPYEAAKGERIDAIAKRFDVGIARLKEHNQLKLKRGKLAGSQTILVPIKGRGVIAKKSVPEPVVAAATSDAYQHQVARGDTLFSVARRYGLTMAQLSQANPQLDDGLKVGQTLSLPLHQLAPGHKPGVIQHVAFKSAISKPATQQPSRYTVKRGDTLHAIAQRLDVSLADLKAWNPAFKKSSRIRAGQKIVLKRP